MLRGDRMKKFLLAIMLLSFMTVAVGCDAITSPKTITHEDAKLLEEIYINNDTVLHFELSGGETLSLYWRDSDLTLKKGNVYTVEYHNNRSWTNPMTVISIKNSEEAE